MGVLGKGMERLAPHADRFNRIITSINDELREIKVAYNDLAAKINQDMNEFREILERLEKKEVENADED
jgi:uncharacterized protein YukE